MDKIISFSHRLLKEVITKDDITIDATAGKGNDTLVLAKISKKVYCFDIQEKAIKFTYEKTKDYHNIQYICDSHANVLNYIKEEVKGVIFNLGYLPGENKNVTTTKESTIKAIQNILNILAISGRCVIVLYPGHDEGLKEAMAIEEYVSTLNQKQYEVLKYQFINQINNPPYLIAIERISI